MKNIWSDIKLIISKSYARGTFMPMLCASIMCLLTFAVIIFLNISLSKEVSIGRIIELMLDPGSFNYQEEPSMMFQLLITLTGAIVFTALLITTISNIFSNKAEEFRNGELSFKFTEHILILGTNNIFYASLSDFVKMDKRKVVMTSAPIKDVRTRMISIIGEKANDFILISGERKYATNLDKVCISQASEIYILGETNERDHDSINLFCFKHICDNSLKTRHIQKCLLEIDNDSTLYLLTHMRLNTMKLRYRFFNPNELISYNLLKHPKFNFQNLIIIGDSELATTIAKMYLKFAHSPISIAKHNKVKLTIIDNNDTIAFGNNSDFTHMVHYKEYGTGTKAKDHFSSNTYDDFLNIEINHIKGDIKNKHVQDNINSILLPDEQSTVVIASESADINFRNCFSLPKYIYEQDIPTFVYQPIEGILIQKEEMEEYYDNIIQFGESISTSDVFNALTDSIIDAIATSEENVCNKETNKKSNGIDIFEKYPFSTQKSTVDFARHLVTNCIKHVNAGNITDQEHKTAMIHAWHNCLVVSKLLDGYNPLESNFYIENKSNDKYAYNSYLMYMRNNKHQLSYIKPYNTIDKKYQEYDLLILNHILPILVDKNVIKL